MKNLSQTLYIEIQNSNLSFMVCDHLQKDANTFRLDALTEGVKNGKIINLDTVFYLIKENIYFIEQKFNCTFKEAILILENFDTQFINVSGFKKLNGSQILKENITYILNSLKSHIITNEPKKNVLHIFNSKFNLDGKEIENLPIGLFGNFYSHEFTFVLVDRNDIKNFDFIFDKLNLKIKKILLKSFIQGAHMSEKNRNIENFFHFEILENNSKIFLFEDGAIRREQNFAFGTNIILKDISKITSLKIDTVKNILKKIELKKEISSDELIEKEYFSDEIFKKIRKKLIYEIVYARIDEVLKIIIFKNINFAHNIKPSKTVYLRFNDALDFQCLRDVYKTVLHEHNFFRVNFLNNSPSEKILETVNKIVHFGWKKEAIPIFKTQKSLISRLFDAIFG